MRIADLTLHDLSVVLHREFERQPLVVVTYDFAAHLWIGSLFALAQGNVEPSGLEKYSRF